MAQNMLIFCNSLFLFLQAKQKKTSIHRFQVYALHDIWSRFQYRCSVSPLPISPNVDLSKFSVVTSDFDPFNFVKYQKVLNRPTV